MKLFFEQTMIVLLTLYSFFKAHGKKSPKKQKKELTYHPAALPVTIVH